MLLPIPGWTGSCESMGKWKSLIEFSFTLLPSWLISWIYLDVEVLMYCIWHWSYPRLFCSLMCRFPDWSHAGCWNMTTLMLLWWIYFIFLLLMLYCKKAALQVTGQIFQCNSSQLFLYGDVNTHKTIFLDKIIQLLYCIYKMLVQLTSSLLKKVFFSVRHNFDKINLDLGCWLFV